MNRKLNNILNIVEILLIGFIIIVMILLSHISLAGLNSDLFILRKTLLILSIISEVGIVSIESVLFILYNRNIKYLYIAYIIGELALMILSNIYLAFSGLFIVGLFAVSKAIIRIRFMNSIYNTKLFRRYCKMFNIKLSVTKTKRKTVKRKNVKRKVTTTASKTIKSYA